MSTEIASSNQIANRAYLLWEEASRPQGRDLEFWLQAEHEILVATKERNNAIRPASESHAVHRHPPSTAELQHHVKQLKKATRRVVSHAV